MTTISGSCKPVLHRISKEGFFLVLKVQFASSHISFPNAKPGCITVKQITANPIIAPSRMRKSVSLFQSTPVKPCHNSMTRNIERQRTATVASSKLAVKILKRPLCRMRCFAALGSRVPERQRQLKSRKTRMNAARLIACRKRPAIMVSIPPQACDGSDAVSAMPPPMACNTRLRKSDVMNTIAIVRGRNRER